MAARRCLFLICASILTVPSTAHKMNSKFQVETYGNRSHKSAYQAFLVHVHPSEPSRFNQDVGTALMLTPYIEDGKLDEAKSLAAVDLRGISDLQSYSGYLTVDKAHGGHLWFWYFPVGNKTVDATPLIVWLQGGPGVSSLYGLFYEIGPFFISASANGYKISESEFSWGKDHSLLFIDSPVGAGYSFINDIDGLAKNQDTITKHLFIALQQFLVLFEELRSAPLFIVGQGYAAKYAASLAMHIHNNRNSMDDPPIKLEGLAIGNGMIDPIHLFGYSKFARQVGLVGSAIADFMLSLELMGKLYIKSGETAKAYENWNIVLEVLHNASGIDNFYNYVADINPTDEGLKEIIQQGTMRRALHVGNTTFASVVPVLGHLEAEFMNSVAPLIEDLLKHYRIMCYSGQLDILVAYPLLVKMYESLYWSGRKSYLHSVREPWTQDGNIVG